MTVFVHRRSVQVLAVIGILISLVSSSLQPAFAYPRPGRTERVSVATGGTEADIPVAGERLCLPVYPGRSSDISASGRYVAFFSHAPNLVPNDTNAMCDVFRHDRKTGETQLVSVASDGTQGVSGSTFVSISGTGRYTAFASYAPNLVPGDTNLKSDVFVRDVVEGTTTRISIASNGTQSDENAAGPSVSGNGRYVAFESISSNIVAHDTNNKGDVFVHDRKTGKTIRVSINSARDQANGSSGAGSINANGRYVSFSSDANNLIPNDTTQEVCRCPAPSIFVHDLKAGKTVRVSQASDGTQQSFAILPTCAITGNSSVEILGTEIIPGQSSIPICGSSSTHRAISQDGRVVIFLSNATNLVPNDSNHLNKSFGSDMFAHDLQTGRTERVSVDSFGGERLSVDRFGSGVMSGAGRFISYAANRSLPPGSCEIDVGGVALPLANPCEQTDGYIFDRMAGAMESLSVSATGGEPEPGSCDTFERLIGAKNYVLSVPLGLSTEGRYVLMHSSARNLVADDTNDLCDYFVHDRGSTVGVGGFKGEKPPENEPPDDRICIEGTCIPPGAAVSSHDPLRDVDDVLTQQGANLYGAALAYRPQYEDLFTAIELEHMPKVLPGLSPIFYGLRFEAAGKSYEVRATSLAGGTFGLFDCTGSPTCTKIADLRGGYGTTGMRVVFSLPLEEIGLEDGGELKDVVAYSGLGSYLTGATKILDRIAIE